MNFSYYGIINAKKYPQQEFLIELTPSKKMRRSLTWKEFNEQTNKVANYLKNKLGVQKGDYVLHLQMNSMEWIVTFHAILRVGAVVVPLNFRFVPMISNMQLMPAIQRFLFLEKVFFPRFSR